MAMSMTYKQVFTQFIGSWCGGKCADELESIVETLLSSLPTGIQRNQELTDAEAEKNDQEG